MNSTLDILVRLETKVDVLNERMDRHEMKNGARFAEVFKKLDNAAEKVHQVELAGSKEDGEIKLKMANMSGEIKAKIAGLSATVAVTMAAIVEGIKHLWK